MSSELSTNNVSNKKQKIGTDNNVRGLDKIVLIGDSLTQTSLEGWGSILANIYQRRADIMNRGCSGYNTQFYIDHVLDTLESFDTNTVRLVLIWFGANDASLQQYNSHHYVPITVYGTNLQYIVEFVQTKYNNPKILLITPPPVVHSQRLEYQEKRYGNKATGILERTLENAGLYAEECIRVATKLNIPVCNMYQIMQEQPGWDDFFHDGLHFSIPVGHNFVANEIIQCIKTYFPELYITSDSVTGQYNNSGSICTGITSWGPYHDQITPKQFPSSNEE